MNLFDFSWTGKLLSCCKKRNSSSEEAVEIRKKRAIKNWVQIGYEMNPMNKKSEPNKLRSEPNK